ncbi:hypothetical protein B0H19DRAFT_1083166 [Mycena capillaripes]|nr:hypothetical protein B0H19DRAFT_1083166 [Mycena capillaripes]
MSSLPISEAQLLTQFLEAICFGIYVVSLGFCLQALLRAPDGWKKASEINKTMRIVTLLIEPQCVGFLSGTRGSAEAFKQTTSWIITVISQTVLGNGMLIYRCWIVYGKSWSMIAPSSALLVATFIVGALMIHLRATLPYGSQFTPKYYRLVTTGLALTICINVLTTGLIVYRIWRVDHENIKNRALGSFGSTTQSGKTPYQNVMRIIIDSGFLYSSVTSTTAAAYIARSNAYTPLSAIDNQIIGITFNLILIRVNKLRNQENEAQGGPPGHAMVSRLQFAPATMTFSNPTQPGNINVDFGDSVPAVIGSQLSDSIDSRHDKV